MKWIATFTVTFMMFFSASIDAQTQQMIKDASMIVEGTVLSKSSYWSQEKTRIFTENRIFVHSVFKGMPSDSIISVITIGGEVDSFFQYQTHAIELQENQTGFFFLKEEDIESRSRLVNDSRGFCIQSNELNPRIYINGKTYFKDQFENLIINETHFPKVSLNDFLKMKDEQAYQDNKPCEISSFMEDETTIEFSFDNIQFVENFTYVEFDIMAMVNTPGLKFGKVDLFIEYTEEFGSSVVANENVEITKGEVLQSNDYSMNYQDASNQTISVVANSDLGTDDLFVFSASPASILHIKMKIQDFSQVGNIGFDDIDIVGQVYYWCNGDYQAFDDVILDGPIKHTEAKPGSEIGITYTFENASTNFNDTELSIDIFAEATEESKFSDAFIYINYNELGFGQNISTNETVSFIQDDLIENTSVYSVFVSDLDENTLQILVFSGSNPNPDDLGILSTEPRKLGSLRFTDIDCEQDKELSFDPITTESDHTHYTGVMPIPYELYDPIIADDEETGKICGCSTPVITGFSPDNIPAGNGDILTIFGQNFGNHSTTHSNVWFKDGDDGSNSWMRAHPIRDLLWNNVIHWNDTEIQVRVPSVDAEGANTHPAASGKIKIENECGEKESDEILTIPYSIFNLRIPNGKARKIVVKELNDGGVCFTYDSDLPSWVRIEFEDALNAWCPHTNISFFINDETVNLNSSGVDDYNIIISEPVTTSHGGAALRFTGRTILCEEGQEEGYYLIDMDIIIDPSFIGMGFPSAGDKTKMENKLKHELGHAHMINHAVIPGEFSDDQSIVFWSSTATSPGTNNITIKEDDIAGANQVFINSQQIIASSCGTPIQSSSQCGGSCSGINSVFENNLSNDIIVFPNPTNGKFLLQSIDIPFENNGTFTITDGKGTIHFSRTIAANTKEVEVNIDLSSGMYFLHYLSESGVFTKKIIVQ